MSSRPALAARARTTEPGARRRGPALTARGAALLAVLLVSAVSVLGPLRAWADQRGELSAARSDVVAREQRVAALQAQSDRWDDPAYVAAQARGRLDYVVPGETGYRVLGAPASAAATASAGVPTPTATASAAPQDGGSLLQRLRSGLGLSQGPVATPTPTPADIAPAAGTATPSATPSAP